MNKKLKERVKDLLVNQIDTRDNDNLLISQIWLDEGVPENSIYFLIKYSKGGFTSAESIRRARQKLQEKHENLRGDKYNERQRKGEEVRQTISK
jgi:hypothetical protein